LINLIQNSIKFSSKSSIITIKIQTEFALSQNKPVSLSVSVTDTGLGIPPEDLLTLFEPYFKSSDKNSQRINSNSHGLGLHISKKIAQNLGGDLSVVSRVNEGSTFCLKLRVDIAPP